MDRSLFWTDAAGIQALQFRIDHEGNSLKVNSRMLVQLSDQYAAAADRLMAAAVALAERGKPDCVTVYGPPLCDLLQAASDANALAELIRHRLGQSCIVSEVFDLDANAAFTLDLDEPKVMRGGAA